MFEDLFDVSFHVMNSQMREVRFVWTESQRRVCDFNVLMVVDDDVDV